MNTQQSASQPAARLVWFKSSYSGPSGGECVEVAISSGSVHVRDSKERHGDALRFRADGWAAFVGFAQSL